MKPYCEIHRVDEKSKSIQYTGLNKKKQMSSFARKKRISRDSFDCLALIS